MKKLPRKIKHWASEACEALDIAWGAFLNKSPKYTEESKIELIEYAPVLAKMNRGIQSQEAIEKACEFALRRCIEDLSLRDGKEEVNFSILFLLAYFNSHISLGFISEKKCDEIMEYIVTNYDVSFEPEDESGF